MKMKKCLFTAAGVAVAIAAIAGGITADMLITNKICCPADRASAMLRHKASSAMHTIGDKITKAADSISE